MFEESLSSGTKLSWMEADRLYSRSHHFCRAIEDMGQRFVVDIPVGNRVYLKAPVIGLPGVRHKRLKTMIAIGQVSGAKTTLLMPFIQLTKGAHVI